MTFEHPTNRYTVSTNNAWLWALLFGPLYLMYKGAWGSAFLMIIIGSFLWLVFGNLGVILNTLLISVLAGKLLKHRYLSSGWVDVSQYS